MRPMPELVTADASGLILLQKIGELDLLQRLYDTIVTTPVVAAEYGLPLPPWIKLEAAADVARQELLAAQVDMGEGSAIALALERPGCILILDDYKARKLAERLELSLTGTFDLLLRAKWQGLIPAVKPLLERIKQTNFRFSAAVELEILKQAGE